MVVRSITKAAHGSLGMSRTTRNAMQMFRKLSPITSLDEDEFLSAWWQVVLCHYTLWTNGVYHRDVSPNNLMVYKLNGKWIGVLNDFDLSSILRIGPSGNEHTGTVPFMALDLLSQKAIDGEVAHLYRHDAESFIWVLVWVCLRYRDGKLLLVKEGRLLDEWLKVDAVRCREKRSDFLRMFQDEDDPDCDIRPPSSHNSTNTNWKLAVKSLYGLCHTSKASMPDDKSAFERRLLMNMKSVAPHILDPADVS